MHMIKTNVCLPALLLIALSMLAFNPAVADQNDERLTGLFKQLAAIDDAVQGRAIEGQIWEIWLESGRSDIDVLMQQGISAMATRNFDDALLLFDRIVEMAPEFAEGWNKRATVYFLRDELDASVRDVQRTLALEPRHFGALSGMGLIFMQIGDKEGALKAFEDVLNLYPSSESARFHVEHLRAAIGGKLI